MRISDWSSDVCSSDLLLMGALSGQGLIRMAVDGDALHKADRWDFGIRIREVEVNEDGSVWLLTDGKDGRSEEHTSELQSLMRISYAVFCLKKKKKIKKQTDRITAKVIIDEVRQYELRRGDKPPNNTK